MTTVNWIDMETEEPLQIHQQLHDLRLEHRDLDDAIKAMQNNPYIDQLQMRRMKKRKLLLKDSIQRLESKLIPDLNA